MFMSNCARATSSDSFQPDAPGALVAEHSGGVAEGENDEGG